MTDDWSSAYPSSSPSSLRDADSRPTSEASRVRPSIAIVTSLAAIADVSPLELPPLNETVDVDALDSLFVSDDGSESENRDEDEPENEHERSHDQTAEAERTWPTVDFRYASHDVRVDGNSSVDISRSETADHRADDWTHVTPVDVPADYGLTTRLVLAVGDRTGRKPTRVRSELERTVDLDALSRLNRRRGNGIPRSGGTVRFSRLGLDVVVTPDGTIAIGSTLTRLKRTGGNVLLTGSVPDALVDVASAKLLGNPDADRRHCVALLDRDVDVVDRRLPRMDAPTRVVTHETIARSSAVASSAVDVDTDTSADNDAPTDTDPETDATRNPASVIDRTPVTGDFEGVREAIETMLSESVSDQTDLEPSSLRLCVDSLRPILEEASHDAGPGSDSDDERTHDTDAIAFLEPLCEAVRDVSALAHYVLPVDRTSPAVERIESLFDATVELRVDGTTAQQRWHLHESSYTTEWFALTDHQ
ncbi:DUF7504 family protein [Natronoglomus mannanivorans]|uniref:DUF7504 family protein n=1 Tax=Natronoglomus mannanivorans TaxID=2979990 RepID=UPI003082E7E6